jgi:hypothetical protein
MDVYGAVSAEIILAPDLIQQRIAGKNPAGMTGEEFQQFVFFKC